MRKRPGFPTAYILCFVVPEKARLSIETIPARVECAACGEITEVQRFRIKCGACGSTDVKLLSGREYYVDSLEVE